MLTISIYDLKRAEAFQAARRMRRAYLHPNQHPEEPIQDKETFHRALSIVGGRLSFLGKLMKSNDLEASAKEMVQREKGWLLSQIGLIPDHDDDVMDEVSIYMSSFAFFLVNTSVAKMELMFVAFTARVCETLF